MARDKTIGAVAPPSPLMGWLIHLYTASGILWGLLALVAIFEGRFLSAYLWMAAAAIIDCTDGPLARRFRVAESVPQIDGCMLDNIVDYLTWTFVPIVLLLQSDWLAGPTWLWCSMALIGSAFAFVHRGSKETDNGYFRGFPSYWNFFAFYVDTANRSLGPQWQELGPYVASGMMVLFAVLTVAPVYFPYPNRMKKHLWFFLGGGLVWTGVCFSMLSFYPDIPTWLFCISVIYPISYLLISLRMNLPIRHSSGKNHPRAMA